MIMFDFGPIKAELKPFPQSAPYAAAMLACGGQVFTADLSCGQAQVVQRGRLRLISRGPVWDTASTLRDQRNALRRLARWPGVTIATPEGDLRGLGLIPLVTPLHHAVWDLSGDLRAGLRGNWRRQLASAERHSIRARKGSMATLAHLVDAGQGAWLSGLFCRIHHGLACGCAASLGMATPRANWRWNGLRGGWIIRVLSHQLVGARSAQARCSQRHVVAGSTCLARRRGALARPWIGQR
jgi:hypothetical protein